MAYVSLATVTAGDRRQRGGPMKRCVTWRQLSMTAAVLAVVASGSAGSGDVALAQTSPSTLVNPIIQWFGPYAITPNDTTRFNYTNFGADAVLIEWAFSNAISGELLAVDLPSIEIFNSMLVMGPDGQLMRSMAFGRTLEVLYPNPVAPTSWSLQRLAGG